MADQLPVTVLQSTVITPLILQAIRLHPKIFFYLYPHIFYFEVIGENLLRVNVEQWSRKVLPWLLSIIFITGICGFGSCFYIVFSPLFGVKLNADIPLYITVITAGLGTCALLEIGMCFGTIFTPVYFDVINSFFQYEGQCLRAVPPSKLEILQREQNSDSFGILLLTLVLAAGTAHWFVIFAGVFSNLDPFYYVFEEVLVHPYERPLVWILLVPILRLILSSFCIVEFVRFVSIVALIVLLALRVGVTSCKDLRSVYGERCLLLYHQAKLLVSKIAFIDNIILILVLGGQIGTVVCLWLIINCFKYLSIYLCVPITLLAFYLLVAALLLIPAGANVRTETMGLIKEKLNMHFCTNPLRRSKRYYYSKWKSQQSIYLKCGPFFMLKRKTTMKYFHILIANLANAVVLVDPR